MQSLNHFQHLTNIILLLRLESIYNETNKKIYSHRISACNSANLQKYRLVVHSDCYWNVANLRASGLCFLEQSSGPLICLVKPVHQEQRRRLTKNVNLKRGLHTVPPWQRRQNLIDVYLHRIIQNVRTQNKECKYSILP